MTQATPLLQASAIEYSYGSLDIIEGVSLDLAAGTVTALVGPNGSGKTTLIRTLAGLQTPDAGSIEYAGGPSVRRIGYLPQHPAFRPGQTVKKTLGFYASLVGRSEADAMTHLERVGLADAAERPVDALSGGMTRLVGLAQAVIGDPPVVVLDEPASGLDPGMRVHIFEVAGALASEGRAVLLSSHDLSLVERTADIVLCLDAGEVAARGSPADIREQAGADSLLEAFERLTAGERGTVRVQGESDA